VAGHVTKGIVLHLVLPFLRTVLTNPATVAHSLSAGMITPCEPR
jgi:hypothetical protein